MSCKLKYVRLTASSAAIFFINCFPDKNPEYYANLLRRIADRIKPKNVLFQQDITSATTSLLINELEHELLPHVQYSPDLDILGYLSFSLFSDSYILIFNLHLILLAVDYMNKQIICIYILLRIKINIFLVVYKFKN